jgi:GNAT superfamily N-acetyltransferase
MASVFIEPNKAGLTTICIEPLQIDCKISDMVDLSLVEKEAARYYGNCFADERHVIYVAHTDTGFVGCGGVSFYEIMPTYNHPSGKCAYIINMYTHPLYRKQGVATLILDLLVKAAKKHGVRKILLEATKKGRGVYAKYGFVQSGYEMEYR